MVEEELLSVCASVEVTREGGLHDTRRQCCGAPVSDMLLVVLVAAVATELLEKLAKD